MLVMRVWLRKCQGQRIMQKFTLSAPYTANFRSAVVQGIVTSIFDLSLTEEATGSIKVRLATEPANTSL